MSLSEWANIATIIGSMAVFGLAVQVLIAQRQIKADHERSRREKTVDLLIEWDKRLKKESALARKIIENLSEAQCRELVAQQKLHVNSKLQTLLAQFFPNFTPETNDNGEIIINESLTAELRWHAITYLNSLESVLVAWQYSVVDREIIEHQFSYLFKPADGHEALKDFRAAAGGEDCYPAIEIFAGHIREKRRKKLIQKANVA
ncbi:hypothetical protein [Pseudoalteromonas gelatinilytica]